MAGVLGDKPPLQMDVLGQQLGILGPGIAGMRPQLKEVRGPVESDPAYVYHATNAERAADIANQGIRVNKPSDFTDQRAWPDGSTQRRNYFTPTAHNSWQFAPEDGMPTLLRIMRADHPFKTESTGDLYSNHAVPPSKIQALTDRGWLPIQNIFSSPNSQ